MTPQAPFRTLAALLLFWAILLGSVQAQISTSGDNEADIELRLRRTASSLVAAEEERTRLQKRLEAERGQVLQSAVQRELNRDTIARLTQELARAETLESELRGALEALQAKRPAPSPLPVQLDVPSVAAEVPLWSWDSLLVQLPSSYAWIAVAGAIFTLLLLGGFFLRRRLSLQPALAPDKQTPTRLPRPRLALVLSVAGVLLLIVVGGGRYLQLEHAERQRLDAERARVAPLMDKAAYDVEALRRILRTCQAPCPADIVILIEARLAVDEAERNAVRESQDDRQRLEAYTRDCIACNVRNAVQQRIAEIDGQAQQKVADGFVRLLAEAEGNETRLRRFVENCRASCPDKLRAAAQTQLETLKVKRETGERLKLEEELYRDARGNLLRLRSYVTVCTICTYQTDARSEIVRLEQEEKRGREASEYSTSRGNLEALKGYLQRCDLCDHSVAAREEIRKLEREAKYFRFTVCNRTKQVIWVAVGGNPDVDRNEFKIEGWWKFDPGECAFVGKWNKEAGFYYTAYAKSGDTWSTKGAKQMTFCIANEIYERTNTSNYKCSASEKLRTFSELSITGDKYTLSLDM